MRNHNERLILSTIHRRGAMPGSDIARLTGLSPQTVSVILRKLDLDGLLEKGTPQRGRVGKPSVPVALARDGLFSVGLKIGRRSADVLLIDFHGTVLAERHIAYRFPTPDEVFELLRGALADFKAHLGPAGAARIVGIGIAAPFEIWNWQGASGAPAGQMQAWRDLDVVQVVAGFTDLPVVVLNDATAACRAEHVYGEGKRLSSYGYFFFGAFVGGGVVLDGAVFEGAHGNAGAFGSLPMPGAGGARQLIDTASITLLERRLEAAGLDPQALWDLPGDWSPFADQLGPWLAVAADQLALAAVTVCAVLDTEAIVIDGAFPPDVRAALVALADAALGLQDLRGLVRPRVVEGTVGRTARALGAASAPIFSQYFP